MSRIGKASISIPSGVTINVGKNNEVTVKGPKGELKQSFDGDMQFEIEEGNVTVKRPTEQIRHKAIHGLSRALLQNMVTGVTEGFKKTMELVGVGYRATITGQELDLALGFSHNIILLLPKEVAATTTAEKGKNPTITLESIDKQLLGQVAAKIRSFRKPEPYKGKGIRFAGEEVRRKAGKTAGK